jgi:hypothetical protein
MKYSKNEAKDARDLVSNDFAEDQKSAIIAKSHHRERSIDRKFRSLPIDGEAN